jgi:hypothetical protein
MKFLMHLSEVLASSKIWIGLCGGSLIVLPILGIMFVHSSSSKHESEQGRTGGNSNSRVSK